MRSTVDMEIGHQSVKGIRRFFPLIVNESHAEAGFHILCAELVRADTLPDSVYQPSVPLSHTGISEGHPQGLTIYKPNPVVGLSIPEFDGRTALRVVSAVMNSMVVKFEESADQGMLSDSALVGEWSLLSVQYVYFFSWYNFMRYSFYTSIATCFC